MAVDFSDQNPTTEGPLDIAKNAGSDNEGVFTPPATGDDTPLDGGLSVDPTDNSADLASEVEILHQKNPLGYTITPPTEEEIEEGHP